MSRFVSAPILNNPDPDPSRKFIVEVDASEVGVGVILSQRSPSDNKVHPCTFFSNRLTPSERNYDIGNKELLAVKLALEEWRHWLEGAGVPFLVWTNHKNLEYITLHYIYAFSRRFYPKRLTIAFRLYIFISTCVPWESNPQPFAQLTQCSTTEPHRNTGVHPLRQKNKLSAGPLGSIILAF